MKKLWQNINAKIYIILPAVTILCFAGFILSLLFPDMVLDTYEVNMTEAEGEEFPLMLKAGAYVEYYMDTGAKPLKGIQVGINKLGQDLGSVLSYDVYTVGKNVNYDAPVSQNLYPLTEGADLQYVYLPFENYEACIGKVCIRFYLEGTEETALMANRNGTENTETVYFEEGAQGQEGQRQDVSLKCSYIYTHETYPFLYDFRILTCIFLAASMAVQYPKRRSGRRGGKTNEK